MCFQDHVLFYIPEMRLRDESRLRPGDLVGVLAEAESRTVIDGRGVSGSARVAGSGLFNSCQSSLGTARNLRTASCADRAPRDGKFHSSSENQRLK